MSVGAFLSFIAQMHGLSKARAHERLAELVERVHLSEVWNQRIDSLSKGYKRRVGIAQALVHDPDVLILDEPTDGLDPNQKHDMRALIRNIAPQKAIVISTHILEEVEAVCTRAIIIAKGRMLADATPAELLARAPANGTLARASGGWMSSSASTASPASQSEPPRLVPPPTRSRACSADRTSR